MRFAVPLSIAAALMLAPAAQAATVSVEGDALRVVAAPGEENSLTLEPGDGVFSVDDDSSGLSAGAGCEAEEEWGDDVTCASGGVARVEVDAGDGDDQVRSSIPLPTWLAGGPGNDSLEFTPFTVPFAVTPPATLDGGDGDDRLSAGAGNDELFGGVGNDQLSGEAGNDQVFGGAGDDQASGGDGDDRVNGDSGSDTVDGGEGADSLEVRDRKPDSASCGGGRDRVRAELLDSLDFACERVDYGAPGKIGRLRPVTGGGRFVRIPGQSWARVDRRILADVLYLIRRYKVRVGDGYAPRGHNPKGEHPLGLAVDLTPGPGGSWRQVGTLAKWAEPKQNRPRWPFRWIGWNGDPQHGDPKHCKASRGCPAHLHLSWSHSGGRPRRPVRTVWIWQVKGAASSATLLPVHAAGHPDW